MLEQAGAVPPRHGRGKWRCGECGHPALSVNVDRALYHCFHSGCNFSGGLGTLRHRLGIQGDWIPTAEWVRQKQERERVSAAAGRLSHAVLERSKVLFDRLRDLRRAEVAAHRLGPTEASWDALAKVYRERPAIEGELDVLETGSAADVFQALTGGFESGYPQFPPHLRLADAQEYETTRVHHQKPFG